MKLFLKIGLLVGLSMLIFVYCKKDTTTPNIDSKTPRDVEITFKGDLSNTLFQIHNRGYQSLQHSSTQTISVYSYYGNKGDTVYVIPNDASFTLTETMFTQNGIALSPEIQIPILSQNGFYCFILN